MKELITGGLGLIGSACCKHFVDIGWEVVAVDNNTRQAIFGDDASTAITADEEDVFSRKSVEIVQADIRDKDVMEKIIKRVDAVVHLAAQPSHPRSLEIPMEDFQINAFGTLQLLELTRQHNHDIPFAFMSTNKVYGDYPNYFNYKIVGKRYENMAVDSFDEQLPIDRCGHTPFGVSKTAADLYTQEYGINYGMKTATFSPAEAGLIAIGGLFVAGTISAAKSRRINSARNVAQKELERLRRPGRSLESGGLEGVGNRGENRGTCTLGTCPPSSPPSSLPSGDGLLAHLR
jgi:nucleoside-diphosphate-sugar epimerase